MAASGGGTAALFADERGLAPGRSRLGAAIIVQIAQVIAKLLHTVSADEANRLDRMEALRLWTVGSSWFSTEEGSKGSIVPGQLADLAVLSADYFSIPDEEIKQLESVLTIVGGKPVYAAQEFETLAPAPPPVLPEWSPVAAFGGYAKPAGVPVTAYSPVVQAHSHHRGCTDHAFSGGFGCFCWAF